MTKILLVILIFSLCPLLLLSSFSLAGANPQPLSIQTDNSPSKNFPMGSAPKKPAPLIVHPYPSFEISGMMRIRYQEFLGPLSEPIRKYVDPLGNQKNKLWDSKAELILKHHLSSRWKQVTRFTTEYAKWPSVPRETNIDRFFLQYRSSFSQIQLGRFNLELGSGLSYDSTFDGVLATYGPLTTGYGRLQGVSDKQLLARNGHPPEIFFCQTRLPLNSSTEIRSLYVNGDSELQKSAYGFSLHKQLNSRWRCGGEWLKTLPTFFSTGKVLSDEAWTLYLFYGYAHPSRPGSFSARLFYFVMGDASPIFNATADNPYIPFRFLGQQVGTSAWYLRVQYAPAPDMIINLYHGFQANGYLPDSTPAFRLPNYWRADLSWHF